jgi:type VI secretion system secreted protein Hcp
MAQGDCFLKLVGSRIGVVKGESSDPDFPGHIVISAWAWGMQSPSDLATGRATGKVQARTIDFSCNVDLSYPALLSMLVTNDVIKTATLDMRRAGGAGVSAKSLKYLSINLKKARLVSVAISHSPSELIPVVRGSLTFEEVEVNYVTQGSHGGAGGGTTSFAWQIADQA